jgi:hypothetical protein
VTQDRLHMDPHTTPQRCPASREAPRRSARVVRPDPGPLGPRHKDLAQTRVSRPKWWSPEDRMAWVALKTGDNARAGLLPGRPGRHELRPGRGYAPQRDDSL